MDSRSFDRALRSALSEDPDVLLVGEMRDLDSIQIALTMAETGHLVFATLTPTMLLRLSTGSLTCSRVASGPDQGPAVIISCGRGRAATGSEDRRGKGGSLRGAHRHQPVRNLIREGKTNQLRNIMRPTSGTACRHWRTAWRP